MSPRGIFNKAHPSLLHSTNHSLCAPVLSRLLKEQLEPSAHGQGANVERGHFGIEPLTEPCRCVRVHASVRRAERTPPLVPCSHFVTIPARSLLSASMGISNLGNYRPLVSRRGPLRQLASNSECMYVCMHACMHRSLMH